MTPGFWLSKLAELREEKLEAQRCGSGQRCQGSLTMWAFWKLTQGESRAEERRGSQTHSLEEVNAKMEVSLQRKQRSSLRSRRKNRSCELSNEQRGAPG